MCPKEVAERPPRRDAGTASSGVAVPSAGRAADVGSYRIGKTTRFVRHPSRAFRLGRNPRIRRGFWGTRLPYSCTVSADVGIGVGEAGSARIKKAGPVRPAFSLGEGYREKRGWSPMMCQQRMACAPICPKVSTSESVASVTNQLNRAEIRMMPMTKLAHWRVTPVLCAATP